ncbi:hypothetical protein MTO96_024752 [Rhipicephalus appendiculatus]
MAKPSVLSPPSLISNASPLQAQQARRRRSFETISADGIIKKIAIALQFPQRLREAPRGPFICTVSVNFTESSLLPKDGLCDIIFYDSFYVKNNPHDWNDTGLDHFFELGRSMHYTSIGASFTRIGRELRDDDKSGVLWSGIDKLRTMGVKHFGMLNLLGYEEVYTFSLYGSLELLSRILEYVHEEYPDGYAVVGLHFLSDYSKLPFHVLRTSLRLRHFIALTHISYPTGYPLYSLVVPMSTMILPENLGKNDYLSSLSIAKTLDGLEYLQRSFADMFVYISFSMRAHYFTVCSEEYGNYYTYNTTVGAEYTYDPQEDRVLVFDSEKGLKEKVCTALVNHRSLGISLAAYDVDYDQEFEECPNLLIGRGSFRRVKALRFMNDYTPIFLYSDPQKQCVTKKYTDVGNPCCPGS